MGRRHVLIQFLYDETGNIIDKPSFIFSGFSEKEVSGPEWSEERKRNFAIAANLGVSIIDHYGNNNYLFWKDRDERAFTLGSKCRAVMRNISYTVSRGRPAKFDSTIRK